MLPDWRLLSVAAKACCMQAQLGSLLDSLCDGLDHRTRVVHLRLIQHTDVHEDVDSPHADDFKARPEEAPPGCRMADERSNNSLRGCRIQASSDDSFIWLLAQGRSVLDWQKTCRAHTLLAERNVGSLGMANFAWSIPSIRTVITEESTSPTSDKASQLTLCNDHNVWRSRYCSPT